MKEHFRVDIKRLNKNLRRLKHEQVVIRRAWDRIGKKAVKFWNLAATKSEEYMSITSAIQNIYDQMRIEEKSSER
jgi:hypothetical protein